MIRVSVGGVDRKTLDSEGVTVTRTYNERATASVAFANGFTPASLQEITIYEYDGTTPMFGGVIHDIEAGRLGGEGPLVHVAECVDWWAYLDWALVNGGYIGPAINILSSVGGNPGTVNTASPHNFLTGDTVIVQDHPGFSGAATTVTRIDADTFTVPFSIPGGGALGRCYRAQVVNLKRVLSDLVTYYLSTYGITLDAAQEDGPTGTHLGLQWKNKFASDVIRDLTSLTELASGIGWVARISAAKALRMVNPTLATPTAPYSISDSNERAFKIKWSKSARDYGNRVVLKCGKDQTGQVTESITITAAMLTAGYVDVFAPSTPTGGVTCTVNGTPRTIGGAGSELIWSWNGGVDGRGRITAGTFAPSVNDVLAVTFTAQFPFYVTKSTGATPVITRYFEFEDITDPTAADAMATGLLSKTGTIPQEIEFETLLHGFAPGQVMQIVLTDLGLNVNGFILSVEAKGQDGFWTYTVKVNTAAMTRTALDTFRGFTASGGGGNASYSGGINTVVLASGLLHVPLGGSTVASQAPASGVWTNVVDPTLFVAKADVTNALIRVSIRARNTGVTVTARLYNLTTSSAVVTGADVTSTSETLQLLTANIVAGNRYVLQVRNNVSGEGIYCHGTLESS